MAETATDLHTDMAMQWCATFTEADYPKCLAIARDMVEFSRGQGFGESMFGHKSVAQSLHFLGQHAEARQVAQMVRREATGFLDCTAVHPYISMGIVLARIASLSGDGAEGTAIAEDTLTRSRRDNPISNCQTLALACAPIAIWNGDGDSARRYALELMGEAEADQLNYWRNWARHLLAAIELQFDPTGPHEAIIELDGLDALLADHLATVDGRAISQSALRRVLDGTVGWSAPDVLRAQAKTTVWYDMGAARRLLDDARALAQCQGAMAWTRRIAETEAELGLLFSPPPSGGPRPSV